MNSTSIVNTTESNIMTEMLGISPEFGALFGTLLSMSALRDWLKLAVIGGAIETCRRMYSTSWTGLLEAFWVTICFDQDDVSYTWVLFWLSQHPAWKKAKRIEVSTRDFGQTSGAMTVSNGEEEEGSDRPITWLPTLDSTYSIWYKGHYMTVSRSEIQASAWHRKERIQFCVLSRSNRVVHDLLLEAKAAYKAAQQHLISIYVSDTSRNWKYVCSRPKRPLRSIILEPGMKNLLLDDARDFLASKQWYADRGIPFRRGYLLYGAPGSGKTSIIQSLAGELGLDVYIVSLSRAGLDDTALNELISDMPQKCIALMEDIDAAFHQRLRREDTADTSNQTDDAGTPQTQKKEGADAPIVSRVTLSGLLNALDGIGAQEGRILFATTNHYRALDPALCRPGRMDLHVEFKLASKFQARELFKCFYMPEVGLAEPAAKTDANMEKATDSGYSSRKSSVSSSSERASSSFEDEAINIVGCLSSLKGPSLSRQETAELADQFAEAIPERGISMASLQGYLMMYKVRPRQAVKGAAAWVAEQLAERKAKEEPKVANCALASSS